MIVVRRRLFWKVYLALLASLIAASVLMAGFWWLVGEGGRERIGLHIHLSELLIPERDDPPGAINAALLRLGDETGADISVYDPQGTLIAALGRPIPFGAERMPRHLLVTRIDLPDGRAVLVRPPAPWPGMRMRIMSIMIIVAVGVGLAAIPIASRLTRRLEALRSGVERWGAGALALRVDDTGDDEVAIVARTFNAAAARVEELLTSQKALLANASHELRSPLARLRMAIELWLAQPGSDLHAEIVRDLAEIDQLVEEILLASRLDHSGALPRAGCVDLLGLAAEEAARLDANVAPMPEGAGPVEVEGDPKLLRRLIRNLLENAVKHGERPIQIAIEGAADKARITVCDHGQGIPPPERERVFEAFYRPAGRAESSGGWGLGLALVRQIAKRHGGGVFCDAAPGGGARFVVDLAMAKKTS
jgi:signal transduction histidine kinase